MKWFSNIGKHRHGDAYVDTFAMTSVGYRRRRLNSGLIGLLDILRWFALLNGRSVIFSFESVSIGCRELYLQIKQFLWVVFYDSRRVSAIRIRSCSVRDVEKNFIVDRNCGTFEFVSLVTDCRAVWLCAALEGSLKDNDIIGWGRDRFQVSRQPAEESVFQVESPSIVAGRFELSTPPVRCWAVITWCLDDNSP